MKRFSEFDDVVRRLEGEKALISELVGKEIVVEATDIFDSVKDRGKEALTIQFYYEGDPEHKYVVKTGSTVLIEQAKRHKEDEPYIAVIAKHTGFGGRAYYSFS